MTTLHETFQPPENCLLLATAMVRFPPQAITADSAQDAGQYRLRVDIAEWCLDHLRAGWSVVGIMQESAPIKLATNATVGVQRIQTLRLMIQFSNPIDQIVFRQRWLPR